MEFLEVPLYDDDLWKLLVRFLFNSTVALVIVYFCYYRIRQNRTYVFNFLLMNIMVFFICFTLKKLDLGLGMALGLFAIFAIIRYRTDVIQVKEMTYLFIFIGVAVINALSNKKTSYAELLATNLIIVIGTFFLERVLLTVKQAKQTLTYDKLELLHPNQRKALFEDIEKRIGLRPENVKIGRIDLEKGNASVTIYYDSVDTESTGSEQSKTV